MEEIDISSSEIVMETPLQQSSTPVRTDKGDHSSINEDMRRGYKRKESRDEVWISRDN